MLERVTESEFYRALRAEDRELSCTCNFRSNSREVATEFATGLTPTKLQPNTLRKVLGRWVETFEGDEVTRQFYWEA